LKYYSLEKLKIIQGKGYEEKKYAE